MNIILNEILMRGLFFLQQFEILKRDNINNLGFKTEKRRMKTSNYKGISFHKVRGRWRSEISISSRNVHLGYFDSAADAARAYDRAVLKRDGRQVSPEQRQLHIFLWYVSLCVTPPLFFLKNFNVQAHLNFSLSDYKSELALIDAYSMEELVAHLRGKSPHHQSAKSDATSARQKQLLQKLQHDSQQVGIENDSKSIDRFLGRQA